MQTVIQKAPAAPWYRHRWPWFIMLGPVAVMLATAMTVLLAVRQPDAMVVDDYYRQGKAINQDLRRDRMATGLRLHLDARYDPASGRLAGRLESFGRPMTAPLRIHLAHPTQPQKDLVVDAFPNAQGDFALPLAGLEMTHWQVVVEDEGRQWRLARSWSPAKEARLAILADAPL